MRTRGEGRPSEEIVRRQPSADQAERPQRKPTLLTLEFWTSSFLNCEKTNFLFKPPSLLSLVWQPQKTNTWNTKRLSSVSAEVQELKIKLYSVIWKNIKTDEAVTVAIQYSQRQLASPSRAPRSSLSPHAPYTNFKFPSPHFSNEQAMFSNVIFLKNNTSPMLRGCYCPNR